MVAKVLVVDDELAIERLILLQFRHKIIKNEWAFYFAHHGLEALEMLNAIPNIDVVLTDVKMPQMDGLTLLERLQATNHTLKTVVISADGNMENIRNAMNRGAFDFLTKPFNLSDLETTLYKTVRYVRQLKDNLHQLEQAQTKLEHDALHDSLTGLPNRLFLMKKLHRAIQSVCQQPGYHYAVLFLDLDRLKVLNDSLGHLVGDELLTQVALRLQTVLTGSGTIARFGGDEFVILLEAIAGLPEVINTAAEIYTQLSLPFKLRNHEVFTSASIGITLSTIHHYDRPEDVLRDADTAMYHAKAMGRGRYELFTPTMQVVARERMQLENDLRQALLLKQFRLYYQPIVSLSEHRLVGFEALIRWQHPTRGIISPGEFIPIAEETGLINGIGWWILHVACAQLRTWQQQFSVALSLVMNVNISAVQVQQADLIDGIEEILRETGLAGSCLKLEITESCLLTPVRSQLNIWQRLKSQGIGLCIDDFGTGYSSLSRLHELPIDTLKIDRSFVSRVTEELGHANIVETIVTLAHKLKMNVVAEGIETQAELEKMQALGCELGQGYLFSRPVDSQAALLLIQQQSRLAVSC